MTSDIELVLIYGSARPGRFCDVVARWATQEILTYPEFSLNVIDPAEPDLATLGERIAKADAFIVVTPEYNHGYTAPLKALIDSTYEQWHAKPVAFVSYGGVSGGLRAVEQLRLVFAELHVVTLRDGVSFANATNLFDAAGNLLEPDSARGALKLTLVRLRWWARALRTARNSAPYEDVT
jgi:NAD(P)H-dependent FMN reductase